MAPPSSFQLSLMVTLLVLAAMFLLSWTHLSLNRSDMSLRTERRSQQLQDQMQLLLDKQRALQTKVSVGGGSVDILPHELAPAEHAAALSAGDIMKQISNEESNEFKLAREVSARYNIRYWLESKPKWSKTPLPVREKFLSFEPWGGGFNNIRMSLEMAAAMAIALNRTLVMPPTYHMYLRGTSNFQDYFDYQDMQRGISVVTYQEFRRLVNLNKVDGFGDDGPSTTHMSHFFKAYEKMPPNRVSVLTEKSQVVDKKIGSQIVFCFPTCGNNDWFKRVQYRLTPIDTSKHPEVFHEPEILHFGPMLLGHFYTMVWFQDPRKGQEVKRLVRDHIHFHEEMFTLAERIIKELGGDFSYSCLHVRRNDFQFKEVWTPAEEIVTNVEKLFHPGETIYIATDELSKPKEEVKSLWSNPLAMAEVKEHAWFEPMYRAWGGKSKVKFWSDYHIKLHMDRDVKKIWIGSVESIVCSRGRVFVGTQKSTFSGYIYRMRGYMHDVGQKEYLEAQSKYPEQYFKALPGVSWSQFPHGAFGGGHPYWGREYKESFEGVYDPFY